jgi:hypothetical protein
MYPSRPVRLFLKLGPKGLTCDVAKFKTYGNIRRRRISIYCVRFQGQVGEDCVRFLGVNAISVPLEIWMSPSRSMLHGMIVWQAYLLEGYSDDGFLRILCNYNDHLDKIFTDWCLKHIKKLWWLICSIFEHELQIFKVRWILFLNLESWEMCIFAVPQELFDWIMLLHNPGHGN